MRFVQVVVLEKGGHAPAAGLSLLERDAFARLYEGAGLLTTVDAGLARLETYPTADAAAVACACDQAFVKRMLCAFVCRMFQILMIAVCSRHSSYGFCRPSLHSATGISTCETWRWSACTMPRGFSKDA